MLRMPVFRSILDAAADGFCSPDCGKSSVRPASTHFQTIVATHRVVWYRKCYLVRHYVTGLQPAPGHSVAGLRDTEHRDKHFAFMVSIWPDVHFRFR